MTSCLPGGPGGRVSDLERFTEGDCWILAKRLHRVTGWPIHSFPDDSEPTDHAFVVTPNGFCLDVQGVCSQAEMCKRYGFRPGKNREFPLSAFDWASWGHCEFGAHSVKRARIVAARLLTAHRDVLAYVACT